MLHTYCLKMILAANCSIHTLAKTDSGSNSDCIFWIVKNDMRIWIVIVLAANMATLWTSEYYADTIILTVCRYNCELLNHQICRDSEHDSIDWIHNDEWIFVQLTKYGFFRFLFSWLNIQTYLDSVCMDFCSNQLNIQTYSLKSATCGYGHGGQCQIFTCGFLFYLLLQHMVHTYFVGVGIFTREK